MTGQKIVAGLVAVWAWVAPAEVARAHEIEVTCGKRQHVSCRVAGATADTAQELWCVCASNPPSTSETTDLHTLTGPTFRASSFNESTTAGTLSSVLERFGQTGGGCSDLPGYDPSSSAFAGECAARAASEALHDIAEHHHLYCAPGRELWVETSNNRLWAFCRPSGGAFARVRGYVGLGAGGGGVLAGPHNYAHGFLVTTGVTLPAYALRDGSSGEGFELSIELAASFGGPETGERSAAHRFFGGGIRVGGAEVEPGYAWELGVFGNVGLGVARAQVSSDVLGFCAMGGLYFSLTGRPDDRGAPGVGGEFRIFIGEGPIDAFMGVSLMGRVVL